MPEGQAWEHGGKGRVEESEAEMLEPRAPLPRHTGGPEPGPGPAEAAGGQGGGEGRREGVAEGKGAAPAGLAAGTHHTMP